MFAGPGVGLFSRLARRCRAKHLLIFASVLARRGKMPLPALLIFAWAGSVLGDKVG